MEDLRSGSGFEADFQESYICPSCCNVFGLENTGGLYGLFSKDVDDAVIAVICKDCSHIVAADEEDPRRLALKSRLQRYFSEPISPVVQGDLAITTVKTLEVHLGDIGRALKFGWPFSRATHHYHVSLMPGARLVVVTEKDSDHDK